MVKVDGDRLSDYDSDEEDGVRKKKERADATSSPYLRQLREDYPAPILPWNWDKGRCALFWIIMIAALIIAIWSALFWNNCPRAGTITQCAVGVRDDRLTSEVNCTTVKEKRNCKTGKKASLQATMDDLVE